MKKRLSLLLCALALVSCGGGGNSTPVSSEESAPEIDYEAILGAIEEQEDVKLLVWCTDAILPTVRNIVKGFLNEIQPYYEGKISAVVKAVGGEGDAASKMVADVEVGADVYFFSQDQLTRLNAAGALDEVPELFAEKVEAENSKGSLKAGTLSGKLIAYPATEDNGYFLYYDKSVLTVEDVLDWEAIIAKAEAQEKEVDINYSSGWYNFGFFYGAGADSVWTTDTTGSFVEYDDTYNTKAGLAAARAMANVIASPRVVDNSEISGTGDNCIAIVDATWDYGAAVAKWGANLGCAELPYFTVNGERYHTGSFSGNKLIGVKPQESEARAIIAHLVGLELNGYEAQEDRYDAKGWGPSNVELVASEKIQAAPHLQALVAQNAYAKPQGQFPGKWWDLAGAIGKSIQRAGKNASDDDLQTILDLYHSSLDSCLDA